MRRWMHLWIRAGSVSLPVTKEWIHATVWSEDGSVETGVETVDFVRCGPEQIATGWVPDHLAAIPIVGIGGRSASGREWGCDSQQVRSGLTNRMYAGSADFAALQLVLDASRTTEISTLAPSA